MPQKTIEKKGLRDPFDPKTLALAEKFAQAYKLVINTEDDWWYGHGLEFPGAMGDGKTSASCVRSTRQSLTVAVATMLEQGQIPPSAAREGRRTVQAKVRFTPEEKTLLEARAKSKGFRGLSDFIRTSALANR